MIRRHHYHAAFPQIQLLARTDATRGVPSGASRLTNDTLVEYALARRVLAAEENGRPAETDPLASADRVLGRLRTQLLLWFGADGVHALYARAVNRAAVLQPMLADVRVIPQDGRHLDRLSGAAATAGPTAAREAIVVLLATLFALLARLVGHDLVLLVTAQIWPDSEGRDDSPNRDEARNP